MRLSFFCWITCLVSACSVGSNKPLPFIEWCQRDRIRNSQTQDLLDTLKSEGSVITSVDENLRTTPETTATSCSDCTHLSLEAVDSQGSRIPLSLIIPKTITALILMTSNGDRANNQPGATPGVATLLRQGVGVVVAHTRTASVLNDERISRNKAAEDLIEAARTLHAFGYSSPKNLFLRASGIGGWAATSAALSRPELFRGLILESPLLDIEHVATDKKLSLHPHYAEALGTDLVKLKVLSPLEMDPDFFPLDLMMIVSLDDYTVPAIGNLEWLRRIKCRHPEMRSVLLYTPSAAVSKGRELSPTTARGIQPGEVDFIRAAIRRLL